LLKRGTSPADTAASVGFADQAHLTRAFKARLGVSPGAYRRAHLDA
jgi:AraC-like DNA-binding protein